MAGTGSSELGDLFGSGTGAWLFQPSISVPLFTAGKLKNNLNLSEVRRDAAVAQYEKAIQGAFRDVSDALTAQQGLAQQVQVLADMRATQAERARACRACAMTTAPRASSRCSMPSATCWPPSSSSRRCGAPCFRAAWRCTPRWAAAPVRPPWTTLPTPRTRALHHEPDRQEMDPRRHCTGAGRCRLLLDGPP
ncbi:TolC family protein [Comamonas testosteroni]|nr:TolC family protein [Comamonas testosteroni]WEE75427.1 TolC family protein [Comamonas testosteroni]